MRDLKTTVQEIAKQIRLKTLNVRGHEKREAAVNSILTALGVEPNKVIWHDAKPCKGANGSIIELSDRYRIQYRCGYGKHNYAPCIEIVKS